MTRNFLLLFFSLLSFGQLKAQQYGLFNTRTLYDGFENPAQKTFLLDSSRQFASNFFLPYLGIHGIVDGNENVLHTLLKDGIYTTENVPLNTGQQNHLLLVSNIYLFNFKIFKSYKFHKELGFSWQLRADAHIKYGNESLAIFDDYRRFLSEDNQNFNHAFNDHGYAQSYHQFSFSYRENYNKRLAFGAKLSLLSGISYNKIDIRNSFLSIASANGPMIIGVNGSYQTSFNSIGELRSNVPPLFKNPGAAISLGTTYTSKSGFFMMGNIKDLGIIRWSNSSYTKHFNNLANPLLVDSLLSKGTKGVESAVTGLLTDYSNRGAFYKPVNAKADFFISKTFDFYTPGLIVSKNIFYNGGDIALVNKFYNKNFSVTVVPTYNFNNILLLGMQAMYQTPNFEFFLGSDNLLGTTSLLLSKTSKENRAYNSTGVYLGASIKFGYVVEHPQNSSFIPGIDEQEKGFFSRLFDLFKGKKK